MSDFSEVADQNIGSGLAHLVGLGQALHGAGAEPLAAYQNLVRTASELATLGKGTADAIDSLNADATLPEDHRRAKAFTMRQDAEREVRKRHAQLKPQLEQLDASLQAAMIPRPHVDTGQRTLIRQEISTALGAKVDFGSAQKYLETASPHHAAELLGDYGRALFQGQGQGHVFAGLRKFGIEQLVARADGNDRQQAARRALQVFRHGSKGRQASDAGGAPDDVLQTRTAGYVFTGIHDGAVMHLKRHGG